MVQDFEADCRARSPQSQAARNVRTRKRSDLSIRRKQAELAMDGNVTMLIWLGKQRLGQRDRFDTEHSTPDGGGITVVVRSVLQQAEEIET